MTVKALRKQFLAAIAMVVVAAVALSSSTYAWFVSQNTVKADGLTVQATAEAGILIRHGTNDFATSATGNFSAVQTLYPTSTVDSTTWFHASADKVDNHAAADGTMKTLSLTATDGVGKDTDGKAYYIMDSFDIYTTGSASNLVISDISVPSVTAGKTDESLRVLVQCGSRTYVFAPNKNNATVEYLVGYHADNDLSKQGTNTTAYGKDESSGYATKILADEISSNSATPTSVTVYVYFEGEDEYHYTNVFKETTFSITLTFGATVAASNASSGS